jgi:glucoamylase
VMAENDPDIIASLPVVDAVIRTSTASGEGFLRYNGDGYGDRTSDGRPWAPSNQGTGHVWPVLAGERGQYEVDRGMVGPAVSRLEAMRNMSSGVGLIAEQAWDAADLARAPFGTDPTIASIGFENGKPAGSASALTWSAGQFVRLTLDTSAGQVLDRPAYTLDRYVAHTQGQTTLTVTAPTDRTIVTSPVTVTGTSAPGNKIRIAATNVDEDTRTDIVTGTTAPDGSFSIDVPLIGGRSVLNIVATNARGDTAHATRTVVVLAPPAPVIFEATDPDNDDNGPGNYRYPTAGDFHDGAFDIEQFQVLDTPGDTLTFRLRLRDLTPTFGSPLGAQLVDVYIHDPAATLTSTNPAHPLRNYRISAAGAWNHMLEVEGFGQRFIDANGNTPAGATIRIRADDISRYITFRVERRFIGNPGPGWGFTVVLTSQDGFSPDRARGFQRTAQGFQLGQCPAATADPHCTFALDRLPKAMDVLTPAGVSQADELDYTLHDPVTIAPVTIG